MGSDLEKTSRGEWNINSTLEKQWRGDCLNDHSGIFVNMHTRKHKNKQEREVVEKKQLL